MAIFDKVGDFVGGAVEDFAGKAFESMTGGFSLSDITNAVGGALKGDFSGLMELGVNALATKFLGPTFGPMAADIAMGLMKGEGLNTEALTSALGQSGILPGTESFDMATNVLGAITRGEVTPQQATELLAGMGVADENLLDFINRIGSGEIDVGSLITGGGFTPGFGGGPGAGGFLTRS